jgi:hypothetical protein
VKAATSYAMEIFNSDIREENDLPDSDYNLMDQIVKDILSAPDIITVGKLINQYKAAFFKKYNL